MADAPFISGSDILSYHGDPALGYSGGGVSYNYNPAITQPLAGVESTISKLEQEQAAQREMDYKARLADRERLAQYLAETGGSVFNQRGANGQNLSLSPLPQDYEKMNAKAGEIADYMRRNPKAGSFDKNLLNLVNEHKRLVANAGERAHFYANAMQEAAASQDPDERDAIIKHAQDQISAHGVSDFQPITPYMKQPITDDSFLDKAAIANGQNLLKKEIAGKDENGNATINTHYYVDPNILDNTADIMSNKQKLAAATRYAQAYLPTYLNNPQIAAQQIQEVDKINKIRAATGETKELPQIFNITQDAQGNPKVGLNPGLNVAQIAYGLAAPKYASPRIDVKAGKRKDEITAERVESAYKSALTKKTLEGLEGDTPAQQEIKDRAKQLVVDIANTYQEARQSLKPIQNIPVTLSNSLKDKGVNVNDYEIGELAGNIQHVLIGAKKTKSGNVQTPQSVYYAKSKNGDIDEDKLIITYPAATQIVHGVTTTVGEPTQSIISAKDALGQRLLSENGFKVSDKDKNVRDVAEGIFDQTYGKGKSAPAQKQATTDNNFGKAIGNSTLKDGTPITKYEDGKWRTADGREVIFKSKK